MNKLVTRIVMAWLSRRYKKTGMPIFYIKGTGKDYPRYLLYTEDENVHNRFDMV